MEQIEREREDQEKKLKKMEQEMEQVFEMKVKEKKKKLKDSETEVSKIIDHIDITFFAKHSGSTLRNSNSRENLVLLNKKDISLN